MDMIDDARQIVQTEIQKLQHELRVVLPQMIQKAVELGDLSENADYKAALERQEFVRIRLGQLSKRLSDLSMINISSLPSDEIGLGSEVRIKDLDTDEEKVYRLVMAEQTKPEIGYISVQSPMAQALLGKIDGDEIQVRTPQGLKNFEILSFLSIHNFKESK
ncbi:GreA/GreB family elongation factor [bacterium]|nr:GreA/GreB family elongation factor [bacterium]